MEYAFTEYRKTESISIDISISPSISFTFGETELIVHSDANKLV